LIELLSSKWMLTPGQVQLSRPDKKKTIRTGLGATATSIED
jgi:hypothetical protein